MTKESPYVGETVAFVPGMTEGVPIGEGATHLSAKIAHVHSHEKVQLVVLDYNAQWRSLSNVPFYRERPTNSIAWSHAFPLDQA